MSGSPPPTNELIAAARDLGDGHCCDDTLLAILNRHLELRRRQDDPQAPRLSGLHVRRAGLPDWWGGEGANLLLTAPGVEARLQPGLGFSAVRGSIAALGAACRIGALSFLGSGSVVAVGDGVLLESSSINVLDAGCVMIGEATVAEAFARIDARNGGAVIVGADGVWGSGITMLTDDMHAIQDAQTGTRVNGWGGRVTVDRRVLLGDGVRLLAGSRLGSDSVVEMRSMIKNRSFPPNSLCNGRPAKLVREGIVWAREDLA